MKSAIKFIQQKLPYFTPKKIVVYMQHTEKEANIINNLKYGDKVVVETVGWSGMYPSFGKGEILLALSVDTSDNQVLCVNHFGEMAWIQVRHITPLTP